MNPLAVGESLSIEEITRAKNDSLTEVSHPAFGKWGLITTITLDVILLGSLLWVKWYQQ